MKRRILVATLLVLAGVFLSAHQTQAATEQWLCYVNGQSNGDEPSTSQNDCEGSSCEILEGGTCTQVINAFLGCKDGLWKYGGQSQSACVSEVAPTGNCVSVFVDQATAQAMVNDPATTARILNQSCAGTATQQNQTNTNANDPGTPTASQLSGRVTLPNPLGTTSPQELIGRLIKAVLSVVGSLTLLMFIYGGVLMLTSAGSPEKVKQGKQILVSSTIGLAIIFSSYIILRYVLSALTSSVT